MTLPFGFVASKKKKTSPVVGLTEPYTPPVAVFTVKLASPPSVNIKK